MASFTDASLSSPQGPFPMTNDKQSKMTGMDPHVLIDALAVIMGHEEKELCKPGHLALVLIKDTADTILGSQERVSYVVISKVKGVEAILMPQWYIS